MGTIPRKKGEQLAFFESHWPVWNAAPTSIGLTSGQVAAFKTLTQTARTSFDAAQAARNTALAATVTQDADLEAAFTSATDLIRVIKSYAEQQANPAAIYAAAQIPPPAIPQPAGPPGTPTDFTVALAQNGAVTLHWKCINPPGTTGTIYEVRRKTGAATDFIFIGAIGVRQFTDDTLPAGSEGVTYQITGVRSTVRGEPAQFNVNFGVGGPGFFITSTSANASIAQAA